MVGNGIYQAEGLVQAHGRLHQRTLRINYSEQLYGCVVLNTFLTFLDNRNVIWKNVMSTKDLSKTCIGKEDYKAGVYATNIVRIW